MLEKHIQIRVLTMFCLSNWVPTLLPCNNSMSIAVQSFHLSSLCMSLSRSVTARLWQPSHAVVPSDWAGIPRCGLLLSNYISPIIRPKIVITSSKEWILISYQRTAATKSEWMKFNSDEETETFLLTGNGSPFFFRKRQAQIPIIHTTYICRKADAAGWISNRASPIIVPIPPQESLYKLCNVVYC